MDDIGRRIRDKREAGGLTQADLARKLKTTANTVARWERGERTPTGLYRRAVERWLGKGASDGAQ